MSSDNAIHPDYSIWISGCSLPSRDGGWAFLIHTEVDGRMSSDSGHQGDTSHHRMEMIAAINALKIVPSNKRVTLHSQDQYLVDGINLWIDKWARNGWQRNGSDAKSLLNIEKWKEIHALLNDRVTAIHVSVDDYDIHIGSEWCFAEAKRQAVCLHSKHTYRKKKAPHPPIRPTHAQNKEHRRNGKFPKRGKKERFGQPTLLTGFFPDDRRINLTFSKRLAPIEIDRIKRAIEQALIDTGRGV
jgi:ribonuclease HI